MCEKRKNNIHFCPRSKCIRYILSNFSHGYLIVPKYTVLFFEQTLLSYKRNGFWRWYLMEHVQNKINEKEVH